MDTIKKLMRRNIAIAEGVIFVAGAIVTYLGTKVSDAIPVSIGSSMLASAIVVFMTDVLLGKTDDKEATKWGLEKVYPTRGEMNGSCDRYLETAKYVRTIAFGLKSWRGAQEKAIERILEMGGSIKVITMKPDCLNLAQRERDELEPEKSMSHSINQLLDMARRLNAKGYKGKIEIRYHDHQPQEFMFLMDNRLFTGPYIYGKNSQQTISFEYNNTGEAYGYYRERFEELWDNSDFCEDALK